MVHQDSATAPIQELMDEHRVIERVIAVLRRAADALEAGKPVPPEVFAQTIDFIRNFADACHHAKEEGVLFTSMEARGFPHQGGPIQVMLLEHEQGRAYVRALVEATGRYQAGDDTARSSIVQAARGYADLLSQHIQKEDNVLYPMAERLFFPDDKARLSEEFEKVEAQWPGVHEKYHKMVEELEAAIP